MNLALDMDDVIADFNGPLQEWHNGIYGTDFARDDVRDYHMSHWGCSKDEVTARIQEFYGSEIFKNVSPVEGSVEAIRELAEHRMQYVVTSRPGDTRSTTIDWIRRNVPSGLTEENVTYLGTFTEKNPKKKSQVCLELEAAYIVEDSLTHSIDCLGQGIHPILLTTPWNEDLEEPKGIARVYSWKEAVEEILG